MNELVFLKKDEALTETVSEFDYLREMDAKVANAYKKSCYGDWSSLDDIKFLDQPETFYIHWALTEALAHNLVSCFPTERDVYEWFRENYKKLLGNTCKIIKKKSNPKQIPDFWIEKDGEQIPVECKLQDFNKKSLSQLNRYIIFYGAKNGIAVASECKCDLPENIIFIKHDVT